MATKTCRKIKAGLDLLRAEFGAAKVSRAVAEVKKFEVELPSWVFGNFGGGRFGEYTPPGAARNISEKMQDASTVNILTGATPRVATHILWDFSEDGYTGDYGIAGKVAKEAKELGIGFGAVNPTFFLRGSFRGSFSADEKTTRRRYVEQAVLGGKIAAALGNNSLALWFPDGSAYPGQIQLREAYENLRNTLIEAARRIPRKVRILTEYKVFEPGTYSTTMPSCGISALVSKQAGPNTGVLVDLGHHAPNTNVEQIVAMMIAEGIPGGFHFNTRYAADDDHSVEPNPENARIFYELVQGNVISNKNKKKNWSYMIDQCCGRENRMHAIMHSVDSLQLSLAKAMLVDTRKLKKLQKADEVIMANRLFNDALINADARPVVAQARVEKGLDPDPVRAYEASGYRKLIESRK